jgi:hypothetical protein
MCTDAVEATDLSVSMTRLAILLDNQIARHVASADAQRKAETEAPAQLKTPQLRRFDSSRFPQISILDYCERLKKFAHFDTALVVALIYIDRLVAADSNFLVTHRNVHRLLLTCATVAEKYYNDIYYCNTYYANVGGISLGEMNRLEVTLLYALMWRLKVSDEEFSEKQRELSRALDISSSKPGPEEWVVVEEAKTEKQLVDAHSEPSTQASGTDESMNSDASMDSDSEDAEEAL